MREICTSGSEGGVAQTNAPSLPPIMPWFPSFNSGRFEERFAGKLLKPGDQRIWKKGTEASGSLVDRVAGADYKTALLLIQPPL